MRQILLPLTLIVMLVIGLPGCSDDVIVEAPFPAASVSYDFWAGARNVEVDGEIFNDGNTFIQSVELEILLFDMDGFYINSIFTEFFVNLDPNRFTPFSLDIRQRGVYDVDVQVRHLH